MAATRVISGVLREVWRETVPLDGGETRTISTGIRSVMLTQISGVLYLNAVIGTPNVTATVASVNGLLAVTITNSAAPGNTATYTLDIMSLHSVQSVPGAAPGVIHVAGAGANTSIQADWELGVTRYYAVDNDSGDDFNVGYSDVSMADAGTKALKTWKRLAEILPPDGNGRDVAVALRRRPGGATWVGADGVTPATLELMGKRGYLSFIVQGTGDFSNTLADQVDAGSVVAAAGPNADQSWTAAGGGTVSTFSAAAGALAGTLELFRVRWKGNMTPALANKTGAIHSRAGNQITVAKDLPAAPAAGDEFFIERPGVVFDQVVLRYLDDVELIGIAAVNAAQGFRCWSCASLYLTFCEGRGTSSQQTVLRCGYYVSAGFFFGVGFRVEGGWWLQAGDARADSSGTVPSVANQTAWLLSDCAYGDIGVGCVCLNKLKLLRCGALAFTVGGDGYSRDLRVVGNAPSDGAVLVDESSVDFAHVGVDGVGKPAFVFTGARTVCKLASVYGLPGATSTYGVVLNASNGVFLVGSGVTVTGSLGDVLLADGAAIATWADVAQSSVVDFAGNMLQSAAGQIAVSASRATNKDGGALAAGDVIRSNGVASQAVAAQADSGPHSSGILGILITSPANNKDGYYTTGGFAKVNFDAAPTVGATAYLSAATAGKATTVSPVIQVKLGTVQSASGNVGLVALGQW